MTLLLTYRNKILLWLSLSSLVILGSAIGIIWPTTKALSATKLEIAAVEKNIQNNQLDLQRNIANQKHASEIERALTRLRTAYITTNNPIDFISRLEQLAEQHHVTLDFNLDTQATTTTTTSHSTVPITIQLTGDLTDGLAFIHNALQDNVYINITDLRIESDSTANLPTTHVHFTIQALTYWR